MSVTYGQCDTKPVVTFPAGTKLYWYCLVTEASVLTTCPGCTQQRGGWDSNPWPTGRNSSTLPLRYWATHLLVSICKTLHCTWKDVSAAIMSAAADQSISSRHSWTYFCAYIFAESTWPAASRIKMAARSAALSVRRVRQLAAFCASRTAR